MDLIRLESHSVQDKNMNSAVCVKLLPASSP